MRPTLLRSAMLQISQLKSLFDAPIGIGAAELAPNERCVLTAETLHRGSAFVSRAVYQADDEGRVHCAKQASLGGTYSGVEPMGLLWSLHPAAGARKGAILMPHSVDPLPVSLKLYREEEEERNLLDEVELERHFVHPGVERVEVADGRLRGAFFAPKDTGGRRLPAILDIYGTGGGLPQPRAALMASRGFAVLSLAVFAYRDLPRDLKKGVDVEYFQEGLDWLQRQPCVDGSALGMVGCSFGALISLMTATFDARIKAVAAINGFHLLDSLTPLNFNGKTLDNLTGDESLKSPSPGGTLSYRVYRNSIPHEHEHVLPVERTDARLLFLVGADDRASPTDESSAKMMQRLERHGRKGQGERIVYPESGHLLEAPYTPHAEKSWHSVLGAYMAWGGKPAQHNRAQEGMWRRLEGFWAENLGQPLPMPPADFH